jgi:CRISPR system Cascade subunit CasC
MHLEIHIIQPLPPSNSNRGKDGDIKSTTMGGVLRTRISSQAQKRAAREWYSANAQLDRRHLAERSRIWHIELSESLTWAPVHQRDAISRIILALFNNGTDNVFQAAIDAKNLLFLGVHEIKQIALVSEHHSDVLIDLADRFERFKVFLKQQADAEMQEDIDSVAADTFEVEPGTAKKKKKEKAVFSELPTKSELKPLEKLIVDAIKSNVPGDVALFGRMMATLTETTVYGAVQVAHAISVNPLKRTLGDAWHSGELDFFSAMDDKKAGHENGAGMIGETSFSAPVLYRYAVISVHEVEQLMGDESAAKASVSAFINGFVRALPDGNKTKFAHATLPPFVLLQAKKTCPYGLSGAFEAPIETPDSTYVTESGKLSLSQQAVTKLMEYKSEMQRLYDEEIAAEEIVALKSHDADGVTLASAIDSVLSTCFA